jgi:DNA modification methylase
MIVVSDCVAAMDAMPAGSIELVACDPPYNVGVDYGDGREADDLADADYAANVCAWMRSIARVLSPTGTLWVVCDASYGATFDAAIGVAGLTIRDRGVWHETFGVWRRGLFGKCWRPWFYAVRDRRRFTFNDAAFMVRSRRQEIGDRRANPAGKIRSNVWAFPRVAGTHGERVRTPAGEKPPTQLPLAMVRMVVEGFTNPGDLVLDPFVGTGTTGVAAVTTGRRFVGIDLRATWADVARQRIEAATTNTASTSPAATTKEN